MQSWPRGSQQTLYQYISINKMVAVHLVTFLHKWVPLAQSVLGKPLIAPCGSLLSRERCRPAIPPRPILGFVPNEPDPAAAA